MIGATVSHYRIVELLGQGGMGVVYRARDLHLDRDVALKFLSPHLTSDPAAKERFIHEAKAASSLEHAAICTIHDVDETPDGRLFIVMAYYPGETLQNRITRGALPWDEAAAIILQLAKGLARAHAHGIIHRDIKPANVIVSPDGTPRILDFGLALLTGQTRMTRDGSTIGTAAYMSPEQLRGEPVDERTDIWSLGVILYEMLTRRLPFRGEFEQGIIYSILNDSPLPLEGADVPGWLTSALLAALEKDPSKRYSSMDKMLVALSTPGKGAAASPLTRARRLRWPALVVTLFVIGTILYLFRDIFLSLTLPNKNGPAGPAPVSVAVLPFTDYSPGSDQEYFCSGFAEELVTALVRIPGLKVVSRTRALTPNERQKEAREVGRELGVGTVLDGSVRNDGGRLRITVGLVDVTDGSQRWSQSYDRELTDIIELQESVARSVAAALRITLAPQTAEAMIPRQTKNPAAYETWLRGAYFVKLYLTTNREEDIRSAIQMYERAIALDSAYALAYGGLAWAYEHRYVYGRYRNQEDRLRVVRLVQRAFALDSANGSLVAGMGYVQFRLGNLDRALELYQRALALAPRSIFVTYLTGEFLADLGLQDRAPAFFLRTIELDPYYLFAYGELSDCLEAAGKYEDAAAYYRRTFELSPEDRVYRACYIRLLIKTGMDARAGELLRETMQRHPEYTEYGMLQALLLAKRGEKRAALAIAQKAEVYSLLGMPAEAMQCLERDGGTTLDYRYFSISHNPLFDPVRSDPRFGTFLEKQKALYEERLRKYANLSAPAAADGM
jgi:serine/threonine protein kinase/tetratricopeptide (TPR) repeat protein